YLGASGTDGIVGIALDPVGDVLIIGDDGSADFPVTLGAFDTTPSGGINEVFVARLTADGSNLAYSSFVGASGGLASLACAVASVGPATGIFAFGAWSSAW